MTYRKLTFVALAALALVTLVAPVAMAGSPNPSQTTDVIGGYRTHTYTKVFFGGELAMVGVIGDGDSDLDLYIENEDGLVAKDDDLTDRCVCVWRPEHTQRVTIRIVNRGPVANCYRLRTN